jgi:hypothetical protein
LAFRLPFPSRHSLWAAAASGLVEGALRSAGTTNAWRGRRPVTRALLRASAPGRERVAGGRILGDRCGLWGPACWTG